MPPDARSEIQESEREVWKLDTCAMCRRRVWCGINETWCRHCNAYVEVRHVEVVPREVAERLAYHDAMRAYHEFRAVFPKADAATPVVEPADVTTRPADPLSKAEEA